jgi:hypothetical protein
VPRTIAEIGGVDYYVDTMEPVPQPRRRHPSAAIGPRKAPRAPRLTWFYAPLPLVILYDPKLSAHAKLVAAAIASAINLGKWNQDLSTTISYAALASLASISRRSAVAAVKDLWLAGYLERRGRGRAGTRVRFTDKCSRNSAARALFIAGELVI